MSFVVPDYKVKLFSHYQPEVLFYMTPLENFVQEFDDLSKPRSHAFYLITWIEKGSGTHTIGSKTYAISPNQLYFLTPGEEHSWQFLSDIKGYNLYFDANFCRGRFGRRLYKYPFFHASRQLSFLEITDPNALFNGIFGFIYMEYETAQSNRYEVILSALHIVLELADRSYAQQGAEIDTYLYDRVRQYEQLVEHQFLTVREISGYAEQMNLAPHYLNQICKKVVGKTASQIFQERVILESKYLLTYTTDSVKEIGFRLGFQDPSYFVRFFKKHYGETPSSFRIHLKYKR